MAVSVLRPIRHRVDVIITYLSAAEHCKVNGGQYGHQRDNGQLCCFVLCIFFLFQSKQTHRLSNVGALMQQRQVEFVANLERDRRRYRQRNQALIASIMGSAALTVMAH